MRSIFSRRPQNAHPVFQTFCIHCAKRLHGPDEASLMKQKFRHFRNCNATKKAMGDAYEDARANMTLDPVPQASSLSAIDRPWHKRLLSMFR